MRSNLHTLFQFSDDLQAYLAANGHTAESLQRYVDRVPVDIEGILPWLPEERCCSFWDIGCGIGGHAALLYAVRPEDPTIFVSEGDRAGPRKVGFMPDTKGWYDVSQSVAFIADNAPDALIYKGPPERRIDLVYSLKSWGHHYPIEVYMPEVNCCMRKGGRIIVDIRTGTLGADILEAQGFRQIGEILSKPKRRRLVFERGE